MSSYNKKVILLLAIGVTLVTVIHLWRYHHRQVPWSTWVRDTWAVPALTRVPSSASMNPNAVLVYIPANIGCKFPLSVNIPDQGMRTICTYDPKVDTEISAHVQNTQSLYSDSDIRIMLEIMRADNNANPYYNKALGGKSGISLVDVGCNIGLFTLSAALNGYNVLSVDAMNSSLQLLATSLTLQNVMSRVTLVHNAISDTHRDVFVKVLLPNNIGASQVLQSTSGDSSSEAGMHTQAAVKAICLDDLIPFVPTHRVFLKMDIESSEWRALRCAGRFFSELDIPYIHMEWFFYKTTLQQEGTGIVGFMSSRGYLPFHPDYNSAPLSLAQTTDWPSNVLWKRVQNAKT